MNQGCVERWKLLNALCASIELVKDDHTQQIWLRSSRLAYYNHLRTCETCKAAVKETLEMARNANHPDFPEDL